MKFFNFIFSKNFLFILVLFTAGVMYFHRISQSPLGSDAVGYAQIAKEMSQTGDYLTPYLDGKPSFHTSKPPMLYWITNLSGQIFGFNSFSARFGVGFCAFLSIIALLFFVNKYFDYITAFFSVTVLIFTQQYLYHARSCVTESPFSLFFMLALLCFYIAQEENKNIFYYLMSAFIGCAIMSKQASGLFIYFVIAGYIVLTRNFKILSNIHFYLSAVLVPVIVLPWHIAMYNKFGMKFINEYLASTTFNISGGGGNTGSLWNWLKVFSGSFFNYIQILINNYEPWLLILIYGSYKKFADIKNTLTTKNHRELFVLSWFFVPFVIFHIPTLKQPAYLNPLYPAAAIICAQTMAGFKWKGKLITNKIIAVCVSLCMTAIIICLCTSVIPNTLDSRKYKDTILLVPEINKITASKKITIRNEDYYYFASFLLFYADRKNIPLKDTDFEKEIKEGTGDYFVLYKDQYCTNILNNYKDKIDILKETKKNILFKNKDD